MEQGQAGKGQVEKLGGFRVKRGDMDMIGRRMERVKEIMRF